MPLITETYYLSLTQDNRGILRLRCSQDDTLRTVNLKLYNNGSIFVIPSGISASISGVKQNGAVFSKPCTISQNRESVVLQLSSDITNVDGIIIAEIVLNDGEGGRLGTSNFIIQVEKNPIRAGVVQDTETPIEYVNDFITQIQALTARVNNLITPNGDPSLAEVVDARISSLDGNTYQNLKARIDADVATLNTRKANKSEVYTKSQVDDLLANVEIDVDDELSDESENPVQNKVINGAISELKADLGDQDKYTILLNDEVPNTTQEYTFSNGKVSQVVHSRNSSSVRTDAFTYGTGTITEVRTLSTGENLTIVTNLTTLETTITYSED